MEGQKSPASRIPGLGFHLLPYSRLKAVFRLGAASGLWTLPTWTGRSRQNSSTCKGISRLPNSHLTAVFRLAAASDSGHFQLGRVESEKASAFSLSAIVRLGAASRFWMILSFHVLA